MKILALYYTNNKALPQLMKESLNSISHAVNYSNLGDNSPKVTLAVSAWERNPVFHKVPQLHLSHYKGNGHLNIILQILQVINANWNRLTPPPFDYVCFLEHDVLYAPNYFNQVKKAIEESKVLVAPVVCNFNYIGMNNSGYQLQAGRQVCLSQLSMPFQQARTHMYEKLDECLQQGWCYLEPTPEGWGDFAYIPEAIDGAPNVHVNMNRTNSNHHLTNHYDTYQAQAYSEDHPLWGHYSRFKIF